MRVGAPVLRWGPSHRSSLHPLRPIDPPAQTLTIERQVDGLQVVSLSSGRVLPIREAICDQHGDTNTSSSAAWQKHSDNI